MTEEERKARARAYQALHRTKKREKIRADAAEYRARNREELRRKGASYRKSHRVKVRQSAAGYVARNPERRAASTAAYRAVNRPTIREYNAAYQKKTAERDREKKRARDARSRARHPQRRRLYYEAHREDEHRYIRERLRSDPACRLASYLRSRTRSALHSGQKAGSAVADLGCSVAELRAYIEARFEPGMSWDNWSQNGWHIDHIRPLASFDLTDRAQYIAACHFTNLQPMWAVQNRRKGARWLGV